MRSLQLLMAMLACAEARKSERKRRADESTFMEDIKKDPKILHKSAFARSFLLALEGSLRGMLARVINYRYI
jgi:hypothetical protein